jgi:hypothetical protein
MSTVEEVAPDHLSGGGHDGGIRGREVPQSLKQLLDDITGVERGGERVKKEILRDDEAKKVRLVFLVFILAFGAELFMVIDVVCIEYGEWV